MFEDIKFYIAMTGVFIVAGFCKGVGRARLPILYGFGVRAARDSINVPAPPEPMADVEIRLARKQQIYTEMQQAKAAGRSYALPEDWDD